MPEFKCVSCFLDFRYVARPRFPVVRWHTFILCVAYYLLLTCGIIRDCAPRKTREMDKLIEERQGRLRDDPVSARLGGDSDVLALAARAKKRVPKKNTR